MISLATLPLGRQGRNHDASIIEFSMFKFEIPR